MEMMWVMVQICAWAAVLYYFIREKRKRDGIYLRDFLTGGCNRLGFLRMADKFLDAGNCTSYVVIYFNISDFRSVNKKWGEAVGNQILCIIYRVFLKSLGKNELVCRSNMDRFIVLAREETDEGVSRRVTSFIEQVNRELQKYGGIFTIRFSVGACRLDHDGQLASAIDNAIYASRNGTEVCRFYDEACARKLAEEKELAEAFEKGIRDREFQVYLQPKVPISSEAPIQAEALVRWDHPQKGLIFPDQFIPLLEKNGSINELDLYMFESVCQLIADWMRDGRPLVEISVNISRCHLKTVGRGILRRYQNIKEQYRIPDGVIQLELTETVLFEMEQIEATKEILAGFRACGLKVALDDFGFAYSSLAILKEFDLDVLKIDRSFFINENEKSRKIVASVIQLAHGLDMSVTAEGIEDEAQVMALAELGCDHIQGYFYSKPLSVAEFERWEVSRCEKIASEAACRG